MNSKSMTPRTVFLHLRIPFSFFLLPVYLFAVAISPNLNGDRLLLVFVILHLFLYPASNAYNSYFDKDEKSIGGLKKPPPVNIWLYRTAIAFDFLAIALGFLINTSFAVMLFIYGMVSKAYSHPRVRIKKYPWLSWFIAGFFQGFFSFIMAFVGINDFVLENVLTMKTLGAAILSSLILWGSYPMTQIYQHEEDSKRGDKTLSLLLGIKGTFIFTGICFALASMAFVYYFYSFYSIKNGYQFLLFLLPVITFFNFWFYKALKNPQVVNYSYTMCLNAISATCLNIFFLYFFLTSTGVLDALM